MTSPSSRWCREDGFCRCRLCKPPLGGPSPERRKPAPGFEALYWVTDLGRVISARTGQTLTGTPIKGYINVRLTDASGKHLRPIHRLVCEAFHGPCPADKEMVGHLDGDKRHNRAANLAWITRSENTLHSIQHGTFKGRPPSRAKLTGEQVAEVHARLASGDTCAAIAIDMGVGRTAISKIKNGARWPFARSLASRLRPAGFDQARGVNDNGNPANKRQLPGRAAPVERRRG
jgi:hypothetical protein